MVEISFLAESDRDVVNDSFRSSDVMNESFTASDDRCAAGPGWHRRANSDIFPALLRHPANR